jgi:uncharacterized membrane protein YagU involved in acid resistance
MADVSRSQAAGVVDTNPVRRVLAGAVSSLIGGLAFGIMMGTMGMLPMVASLVGSDNAVIGFIVHMVISAIIGAGFGLVFGAKALDFGSGALWGAIYGVIWWILGPLLIMPSMMGMGPQFGMAFAPPNLMSLVGHLVYGVATGLVYPFIVRRVA